ncbi:MAG: hypothetical protein ACTHMX_11130 [Thermomicrobiales bacterium]
MSEDQYYEFRAIDRALSLADKQEIRSVSTRARITGRSFMNHDEFGDVKGDPWELMAREFDLHLYVANWGTRRLMIRLPRQCVPLDELDRLNMGVDEVEFRSTSEHLILSITQQDEGIEDDSWMIDEADFRTSFAPLRDDLIRGDRR